MKRHIDSLLISAAPAETAGNKQFVHQVMHRTVLLNVVELSGNEKQTGLHPLQWVKRLHGFALLLFIAVCLLGFGGVVYAAVRYLPTFIQVDSVQTNQRGQTEYTSKSFAACKLPGGLQTETVQHFALKSSAPKLSTDEVAKILQAKCELTLVDDLARSSWPTYSTSKIWKTGDTIYYARADGLGGVKSINNSELVLSQANKIYKAVAGKSLQAVSIVSGKPVALRTISAGSAVMEISRVAEQYTAPQNREFITSIQPKDEGTFGVIAFDLSIDYYTTKQNYLTDIANCTGNGSELCPHTASIDIYPRKGGEGASNPYLSANLQGQFREIAGTVIAFTAKTMTLKSIQGTEYNVILGESGFSEYNQAYASIYISEGSDAQLRVGSFVAVRYLQPANANPRNISPDQVENVSLLLDDGTNLKTSPAKQY